MVRDSFRAVGAVRTISGALLVSGGVQRIRPGSGSYQSPLYYSDAGIYRLSGTGEELELTHAGLWASRFHVAADGSILASRAGDVRNNDPQTWRSADDGRTWERYDRGLPYTIVNGHASLGDTLFAATTAGLYHVAPDFSPTSGIVTAEARERDELLVRPNPATGSTTITFELARASECRLELFDLNGEVVRELARRRLPAGVHDIEVAMGELPAGMYHVRLVAGELMTSRSIFIQR